MSKAHKWATVTFTREVPHYVAAHYVAFDAVASGGDIDDWLNVEPEDVCEMLYHLYSVMQNGMPKGYKDWCRFVIVDRGEGVE